MNTVGELIDELSRFPRDARVSVTITTEQAFQYMGNPDPEPMEFKIEAVQPIGCNQNDTAILLGSAR
jgi:hypothetical protein